MLLLGSLKATDPKTKKDPLSGGFALVFLQKNRPTWARPQPGCVVIGALVPGGGAKAPEAPGVDLTATLIEKGPNKQSS